MATPQDTTTFFQKANSKQFDSVLKLYPQAIKLKADQKTKKPEELIKLDNWYQNELPKKIKSRGKDAHMVHEELVQLMKWKQSRGKFYPQLSYLVKVNTPRAVMAETKRAFKKLPNIETAITALSNLKGIGTTTASALLAAASPDIAPFMADECLQAIPEMDGIDYTAKEYLNFVAHVRAVCDRLNQETNGCEGKWSPHRVELAVWTHSIVSDLRPELLDDDRCSPLPSEDSNLEPPITNGKISAEASDSCTEDSLDKAVSAEGSSPHTPPTPNTAEDTCDSFISNNDNAKRSAEEGSSAEENSLGADSLEAAPVAKKARAELH